MKFVKLITLFIISLFVVASSFSQQEAGCSMPKCHSDIGTKEFIHGPVGAGLCKVCHTPVEGKDHQFNLAAEKDELCFACHEEKRDMMLEAHLHTPVADGNCIGCHDPHQSDHRFTLKGKAADLCFQCHKKDKFSMEHVHGPVGVGDCNACHNPHASANEKQLHEPPDKICFSCHQEKIGMLDKRHVHDPVAEACTNCHNPHSEKSKFMLPNETPDLCYDCHGEIASLAMSSVQHPPVADGGCLECHDVHSTDHPKMFRMDPTQLCFSCHDEMRDYIADQDNKHGPVKDGDCNACHSPHGSDNYKILKKFFPKKFYMPYDTENYALCFDCHNKDIALEESTTTLTDFRDGDRNLHFLHVNKDPKGRSCKACHQAHATDQEKHIRTSVPFGSMNWELPIKFTKLDNGGSCVVGCHKPKEYRR